MKMFSVQDFCSHLTTKKIGHNVKYYDSIDSTNTEMSNMVSRNEINSFNMIITDNQKNGRGRYGNQWISSQFNSITCSIVINNSIENLSTILPLSCGIAIVEGIYKNSNINCELKWPNDIMFNKKKIGGILIEKKSDYFIVGLGLNVNQRTMDDIISKDSCSLRQIINKKINREFLLADILNALEKLITEPVRINIRKWEKLCYHINKNVSFSNGINKLTGVFLGLSDLGYAKMKIDNEIYTFNSGVIEL